MKFLAIGAGLIGNQHIKLMEENKEVSIEAIVALNIEGRSDLDRLNVALYSSLDDAFAKHNFDAAVISSPNHFHYEHALRCIERKIPVLVEKPLCDSIEKSESLVKLANESNVPLLVGHHRAYSSFVPIAKDIINSEKFGKLVAIQGSALFYKPKHYFEEGIWRTQKSGGGPILINLIHEIGIMRELCGEIKEVFAFASNATRNFEVEDTVSINLKFESGCLGTFLLSDCTASLKSWEMTSGENPSYPHYPKEACYHFAGTNGSLDFPNMNFTYYDNPDTASWWKAFKHKNLSIKSINPLQLQLEHFIKVIKGEELPIVDGLSGYRNIEVLNAIQESIIYNKAVSVITKKII